MRIAVIGGTGLIGTRLVARSARGVTLTRAGERFLVHAERALRAIEAGVTEIDELNERPRGTVSVGAIPTVRTDFLSGHVTIGWPG